MQELVARDAAHRDHPRSEARYGNGVEGDANGSDEAHRCTWGLRRFTRGRGPGGWSGSARASSSRCSR